MAIEKKRAIYLPTSQVHDPRCCTRVKWCRSDLQVCATDRPIGVEKFNFRIYGLTRGKKFRYTSGYRPIIDMCAHSCRVSPTHHSKIKIFRLIWSLVPFWPIWECCESGKVWLRTKEIFIYNTSVEAFCIALRFLFCCTNDRDKCH